MKMNRLMAAALALSCAFTASAFATVETETTAEPSATAAAPEQTAEASSEAPSEQATEAASEAPASEPAVDINAPKLYERPEFIPVPTPEPGETPQASEEAESAAPEQTEEAELLTDSAEDDTEADADNSDEAASEQPTEAVPSEAATEDPAATVSPTAAPTAAPTPLPSKQTAALNSLLKTVSLDSKYTDTYYADIKAVIIEVSENSYTYGNEYDAVYDGTALTERQFKNLMAGYVSQTLEELDVTASDGTLYGILPKISIRICPEVSVTTTPVFEKKATEYASNTEWYYFPEYTAVTNITAPTPTPTSSPTATPTATPKPSATDSPNNSGTGRPSSGGGSSQIAPGIGAGGSGSASRGFTDLDSVPWAKTAINTLAEMGILHGRSETVFDPNANITRAEYAKLVCTALNIPSSLGGKTFTDVSASDWFYPYVMTAAAHGIVNGVSDTAFDPNAVIKREDMAAMLYRAIKASGRTIPDGEAKSFADEGSISDYAKESVAVLSGAGIINGISDTEFSPAATATRAQAAAIIYQYFIAAGIK